ncbi:MAG: BLUF domain-containing protein, partial [Methyloceanibacter sp.]|uniref:BLUF domain-containing protein n=1 Tax=Methyloceanibacter sp. TaxID=1965321 RepID=UPI003D9AD7B1
NNEAAHVTGALLATDNRFAQVLEGDRAAVEETYRRICADTRHTDIVMVLMEPIARQFPQWSMACIGPSQSAAASAERVTSDVPHFKTGDAARALTDFMSRMLAVEAPTPAAN